MKSIIAPLPFPGATYEQRYFNETIRTLNLYFRQLQNPGDSVVSTLRILQIPTDPGALPEGSVWLDTATGVLRIVDSSYTRIELTGSSATAAAGTVTP